MNIYKLIIVETQCLASHCWLNLNSIKRSHRDAKHCVSTLGLAIQIRI
ncbi:MAG: hypothetical protein LBB88_10795 [Planctomycetaceae bacterium]|nr:hypothetical protein [Planctomycetaceae bacterium]